MESIKIPAAGETWVMRNGGTIVIDKIVDSDPMPVKHGPHMCWQSNGRYWEDGFDHKLDLIQKVDPS